MAVTNGVSAALVPCMADYIEAGEFLNHYTAANAFLHFHSAEWRRFLDARPSGPPVEHRPYQPFYHDDYLATAVIRMAAEMFTNYLAELLRVVFVHRPEVLRSSAQVKAEDVLRHASMDDFVAWYAQRRVNELAYLSLVDLDNYFIRHLGLPICEDSESLLVARRWVARRNLLVHGRGYINEVYREAADEPDAPLGERLPLDLAAANEAPRQLFRLAEDLDARAIDQFGLPFMVPATPPDDSAASG